MEGKIRMKMPKRLVYNEAGKVVAVNGKDTRHASRSMI
jgi:hypothetical protein